MSGGYTAVSGFCVICGSDYFMCDRGTNGKHTLFSPKPWRSSPDRQRVSAECAQSLMLQTQCVGITDTSDARHQMFQRTSHQARSINRPCSGRVRFLQTNGPERSLCNRLHMFFVDPAITYNIGMLFLQTKCRY